MAMPLSVRQLMIQEDIARWFHKIKLHRFFKILYFVQLVYCQEYLVNGLAVCGVFKKKLLFNFVKPPSDTLLYCQIEYMNQKSQEAKHLFFQQSFTMLNFAPKIKKKHLNFNKII